MARVGACLSIEAYRHRRGPDAIEKYQASVASLGSPLTADDSERQEG